MLRVVITVATFAAAQGFALAPLAARTAVRATPVMAYEDAAQYCLEEYCSVDTVEELKAVPNPTAEMKASIKTLQQLLEADGDNSSEIEKIVAAAARSFSVVPGFTFPGPAIGYTGKVGTTTTAGASLD